MDNKIYGLFKSDKPGPDSLVQASDLSENYYCGSIDLAVHTDALTELRLSAMAMDMSQAELEVELLNLKGGLWRATVKGVDMLFTEGRELPYMGTEEDDLKKGDMLTVLEFNGDDMESLCQLTDVFIVGY